ncbi:REP-associated tyrosine transposase [Candidatus Venteria ishoeyi]|uniref:Transposase IS200 like protein n=1 Tax=Candidatus Venteria ishoeyi TaxID=1899563 RepID=A0A1H6F6G3_9GAMM|nr:transposase [Candidatus Venteria ishoeyi]SEH04879.1 Transposase IS200 like protein [Candidatus Venteria ishoeyi]
MVLYRRNFVPGGMYFFTVTLADRRQHLLTEHIDLLRTAFRETRNKHAFDIQAIVILPEHLHTLWKMPEQDSDYPGRWKAIKSRFTHLLRKQGIKLPAAPEGGYRLWQRRYWEHTIRNNEDWERHFNYIHYNPVKHGWVKQAIDWPYSSFHRYVRLGWLTADWGSAEVNKIDITKSGEYP